MVDIHSHILYGVDDGVKTIEESLTILNSMKNEGYTDIILTPHYIKDSMYNHPKSDNQDRVNHLKSELKKRGIDINIYLGNEIYIDEDIYDLLENEIISSLNGTKYVLIEIPMSGIHSDYKDIFSFLMSKGYKVILAHPERYLAFQKDFSKIYELTKIGVLLQSNLDSILGGYGLGAKKTIKRLLKEDLISFLGTDIHHQKSDYTKWKKARKQILKYSSLEKFKEMTNINPKQIID